MFCTIRELNKIPVFPVGTLAIFPVITKLLVVIDEFTRESLAIDVTGLTDLKFHDLRKTFGSMLAQRGVSTAVTQQLLEHSSSTLTNKIYTNVDPVLRQSINRLPIKQWLQK